MTCNGLKRVQQENNTNDMRKIGNSCSGCPNLVWRRRPEARDSAEGSGVSPIHSLVLRNAIFNDF